VVTAGCAFPGVEPESRAGVYDVTFGLDVSGSLSNATIRVPLPAEDSTSVLNASVLDPCWPRTAPSTGPSRDGRLPS